MSGVYLVASVRRVSKKKKKNRKKRKMPVFTARSSLFRGCTLTTLIHRAVILVCLKSGRGGAVRGGRVETGIKNHVSYRKIARD